MDAKTIRELTNALEKEKQKLTKELRFIANPDPNFKGNWDAKYPHFEPVESGSHTSLEEQEDEFEEYEVRLETEHSLESRLLNVTKALERVERGTYGTCGKCKKAIPLERLKANPAAEFDIEHTDATNEGRE